VPDSGAVAGCLHVVVADAHPIEADGDEHRAIVGPYPLFGLDLQAIEQPVGMSDDAAFGRERRRLRGRQIRGLRAAAAKARNRNVQAPACSIDLWQPVGVNALVLVRALVLSVERR
jgi:hypothetical protein